MSSIDASTPMGDASTVFDSATGDVTTACTNAQTSCRGQCTLLSEDVTNCGVCGRACASGQVCSLGECALSCAGGTTACGSLCVQTALDPANCGTCGTQCEAGTVCSNGTCTSSCTGTLTTCGGGDAGSRYCANTATDNANCGSCGYTCASGSACTNRGCSTTCGNGQLLCTLDGGPSYCTNLQGDPANCGACENVCGSGMACSGGGCVVSCPGGQINCNAACVDPTSNNQYCGATAGCGTNDAGSAGTACGNGQLCSLGACAVSCPGNQINCNGTCVDPTSNNQYCGATAGCGTGDAGSPGTSCVSGQLCGLGTCAVSCPGNQINCNGTCVDPTSNNQYCGATAGCGTSGGSAGAVCGTGQLCGLGTCAVSCPGSQINCNGTCVDPTFSNQYCGATSGCGTDDAGSSGTVCSNGQLCALGACAVSCPGNQISCNGACVDPTSNNQYCGATNGCGAAGMGIPGTMCGNGQICGASVCAVSCPGTQINCNGTCIDPTSNNQYCGATNGCGVGGSGSAGTTCNSGQLCNMGACAVSCPGTQINCDGECVDPTVSDQHCGATAGCGTGGVGLPGTACSSGLVCNMGGCAVACPGTQINCNGTCVDPMVSNQYCGATTGCGVAGAGSPGTVCAPGNVCNMGACSVSCPGTQINCGGVCVDSTVSNQYCGATPGCGSGSGSAGTSCGNGTVCSMSVCTATCASPLSSCINSCVDERNDPQHCGSCSSCSNVANASSPVCRDSMCVTGTCSAGFSDCNGVYADGCEVDTTTDKSNCGFCGNVCPSTGPICSSGVCGCLPSNVLPPAACTTGLDPESTAKWVVCTADCTQAWISDDKAGGGQYHALQICNSLGYTKAGGWSGNYGTICGTDEGAGSCAAPQTPSFSTPVSTPDCGMGANGPVICNTVEWQCLP